MKELLNYVKWWWNKKCLKCGGALQTKHYVGYKGEGWIQISRTEQVCADCGDSKRVY